MVGSNANNVVALICPELDQALCQRFNITDHDSAELLHIALIISCRQSSNSEQSNTKCILQEPTTHQTNCQRGNTTASRLALGQWSRRFADPCPAAKSVQGNAGEPLCTCMSTTHPCFLKPLVFDMLSSGENGLVSTATFACGSR